MGEKPKWKADEGVQKGRMMDKKYEQYRHHGKGMVWVNSELKGRHKDYCLCYSCTKFIPQDRNANCVIADLLYATDCAMGIVTPVFECPNFEGFQ